VPEPLPRNAADDARAPRRLHRRRVHGAPVVMLLAGALGLVLTLAVLRDRGSAHRILVAARDLEAGVPLRASDVRAEALRADADVLSRLVSARAVANARGSVLTTPLDRGTPLLAEQLRARPTLDGRRSMSIAVDRARAVNGRLAPGDRVDVVVARDGVASVVAAALEVLDVDRGDDGAFASDRRQITVTLAVDVDHSQRLAAVLADGDFVLTRVTGAVSADGAPPVVVEPLVSAR
jgi:Flp pilus assembly protein CpaB